MTYPTQVLAVVAMMLGGAYMALTIFFIHTYEAKHKKPTPAVYFWPFNKELSGHYPSLSKTGRFVFVAMLLFSIPPFLAML